MGSARWVPQEPAQRRAQALQPARPRGSLWMPGGAGLAPPAARSPTQPLAGRPLPARRTHAFPTWMRGTTSLLCALGRL